MPTPIGLRETYMEEERGRLVAVFVLSETPGPSWIGFFRERAGTSVFDAAAARFSDNTVKIALSRHEDLAPLIYSVERYIEGANLDADRAEAS
jgi:hypothetical protein